MDETVASEMNKTQKTHNLSFLYNTRCQFTQAQLNSYRFVLTRRFKYFFVCHGHKYNVGDIFFYSFLFVLVFTCFIVQIKSIKRNIKLLETHNDKVCTIGINLFLYLQSLLLLSEQLKQNDTCSEASLSRASSF